VAAMPSVGRIKRVSVAGVVATALFGAAASNAAAGDVWMWTCHGPASAQGAREPITAAPVVTTRGDGASSKVNGGCGSGPDAISLGKPGPAASSSAELNLPDAPNTAGSGSPPSILSGLNIKQIRVIRRTRGLTPAPADQSYALTFDGQILETSDKLSADDATYNVTGSGPLTFKVSCGSTCAEAPATVGVDVVAVAFLVSDTEGPYGGGVGRNNPVISNTDPDPKGIGPGLPLRPAASDSGSALDRAEVTITNSNASISRTFGAPFNAGCTELSPADGTIDRPLDTTRCPRTLTSAVLNVDWNSIPAGNYTRTVKVYDVAGNSSVALDAEPFEIIHPDKASASATLSIASGAFSTPEPTTPKPGGSGGTGGRAGTTGSACHTPRLSVVLASKPVRISNGVPVLLYKKKYRFKGRLTCVINGKRKSAPKRTKVEILNTVGKKTVKKPRTAIRSKGAVDLKLAFTSSRTVIFRFTSSSGRRSQVKIKLKIVKKSKR
jgi:hypothetical protein